MNEQEITCQWFALCTNVTITTIPHPVLGDVPTCARCEVKYWELSDDER